MTRFNDLLNGVKQAITTSTNKSDIKSQAEDGDFTQVEDMEVESPEMELMEYKYDFYQMSMGSILSIAQHAQAVVDALKNPSVQERLTESWLQGKIAVTEDYMLTIHNFLMFGESETDTEGSAEAAKNLPGLWENIRKKKDRMGKKYKPAKPGDKDRPDPKQWKELTKGSYEYRCPKCGLQMEYDRQRSGYKCPNDGTTMQRVDD
jgi:hypothetical protein